MLNFSGQFFYLAGVANKKSVASFVAQKLINNGAKVIFSAQNEKNLLQIQKHHRSLRQSVVSGIVHLQCACIKGYPVHCDVS